jgi:hypothetical protein
VFPTDQDQANDDTTASDEDYDSGGSLWPTLFVVDAPGPSEFLPNPPAVKFGYRQMFEEFVRVDVNGTMPEGNGNIGSRASLKQEWTSQVQLQFVDGNWERTANFNQLLLNRDDTLPD